MNAFRERAARRVEVLRVFYQRNISPRAIPDPPEMKTLGPISLREHRDIWVRAWVAYKDSWRKKEPEVPVDTTTTAVVEFKEVADETPEEREARLKKWENAARAVLKAQEARDHYMPKMKVVAKERVALYKVSLKEFFAGYREVMDEANSKTGQIGTGDRQASDDVENLKGLFKQASGISVEEVAKGFNSVIVGGAVHGPSTAVGSPEEGTGGKQSNQEHPADPPLSETADPPLSETADPPLSETADPPLSETAGGGATVPTANVTTSVPTADAGTTAGSKARDSTSA